LEKTRPIDGCDATPSRTEISSASQAGRNARRARPGARRFPEDAFSGWFRSRAVAPRPVRHEVSRCNDPIRSRPIAVASGGAARPRPLTIEVELRWRAGMNRVTDVMVSAASRGRRRRNAVETVAETLRDLRVAEVIRTDVTIENCKVSSYRVRLDISSSTRATTDSEGFARFDGVRGGGARGSSVLVVEMVAARSFVAPSRFAQFGRIVLTTNHPESLRWVQIA
jgi:dodecin